MHDKDPIVIVAITRTPLGAMLGDLASLSATDLGGHVIKSLLDKTSLSPESIDELYMGCVLPAGLGQAPARQAGFKGGLHAHTGATTINKVCGSGMKTIMFAHDLIQTNQANIVIAGGMESMTNAPFLIPGARKGFRFGHQQIIDHMFYDGLEDTYDAGKLMGCFADETAKHFGFSRGSQDEFALTSLSRANEAITKGYFTSEISPVSVQLKKQTNVIDTDELPLKAKPEKIPTLKPAFAKDGTVTAANSSSISDGAAALLITKQSIAHKHQLTPLATIKGQTSHAQKPAWFTTAPIEAVQKLYAKTGWTDKDVDLYEINEAFAVVAMACMKELKLSHEKVNVHGGACALGHPIGASGARIVVTLLSALKQRGLKRGIATLCIGGGEATALALECH